MGERYMLDGLALEADDRVFVIHDEEENGWLAPRPNGFYRAADVLPRAPSTVTENSLRG